MHSPALATVSLLTPSGRGAVAVLVVQGPDAAACVAQCFRRASGSPWSQASKGEIAFGRWTSDQPEIGEEVVVAKRGDDQIEIHCHGGLAASQFIMQSLERLGVARLSSSESWRHSPAQDALSQEAWQAFAEARTTRTAALLAHQATGALRLACETLIQLLADGRFDVALARLERMLALAPCGLHLTAPWRVVLVGPPNVGKSSLINRLVGFERAIVADRPGTTRDIVTATTAWEGWPLEFSDTAGIRESNDPLEAEGIARTHAHRLAVDCQILVTDLTQPWSEVEQPLFDSLAPTLVVHNKADLGRAPSDSRPQGIEVSAISGQGIEPLLNALVARLIPVPPASGEALPFNRPTVAAISEAACYVRSQDIEAARDRLVRLVASGL